MNRENLDKAWHRSQALKDKAHANYYQIAIPAINTAVLYLKKALRKNWAKNPSVIKGLSSGLIELLAFKADLLSIPRLNPGAQRQLIDIQGKQSQIIQEAIADAGKILGEMPQAIGADAPNDNPEQSIEPIAEPIEVQVPIPEPRRPKGKA
jgi:hypothetical protein